MELYQLRTFVAIAQEGSLTRAAETVFTSPPAVSAQLKALEDELGVKLFERSARGMELTESGRRLLDDAQRTLASAGEMRAAAARLRGAAQGQLRMGMIGDPLPLRLGEVLLRLAEQHPQVGLQLQQLLSSASLAALRRGELDCAYVMSHLEQEAELDFRRLGQVELVVALPPALAAAHPGLDLPGLAALPWVGTPPGCALRRSQLELFGSAGHEPPQGGATADREGLVLSMVASGMGAGIVRADLAELAQRQGQLVIWPGWRGHTWLCWAALPAARAGQAAPALAALRAAVLEAWGQA